MPPATTPIPTAMAAPSTMAPPTTVQRVRPCRSATRRARRLLSIGGSGVVVIDLPAEPTTLPAAGRGSVHPSGCGLTLFLEELRQRAVRAVHHGEPQIQQEVDDLGAGHEITRAEALECLVDRRHQVGCHGRLLGHAAPFGARLSALRSG